MKDTLLVYYSLEGNTGFAAQVAADTAEMDVQRLIPDKEPPKDGFGKFMWGGKSVVFHEIPKLDPQEFSPAGYKNIILAFPVWASSYPPAIAAFLKENDLSGKDIWAIICSASGDARKALAKLEKKLPGCRIVDSLSLTNPAKDKEKNRETIRSFISKNFGNG